MKNGVVELRSEHHSDPPERIRHSGRAIIVNGNKILLSHEQNTDIYMSPGGATEKNEKYNECCEREVLEETGYIVKALNDEFITVYEYCFETLFISHYFICEIIGTGERSLTQNEIEHGITPEWISLDSALEIFGSYSKKREDWGCLYKREFTVLNKYLENRK